MGRCHGDFLAILPRRAPGGWRQWGVRRLTVPISRSLGPIRRLWVYDLIAIKATREQGKRLRHIHEDEIGQSSAPAFGREFQRIKIVG